MRGTTRSVVAVGNVIYLRGGCPLCGSSSTVYLEGWGDEDIAVCDQRCGWSAVVIGGDL